MSALWKRDNSQMEMEWIRAAQCGDARAFRRLFDTYRDPVHRLAYRFTGHADEAEDAAQEIFVRLFERIGSFRGDSSFSTWLYRLAVRHCLNRSRKVRDEVPLEDSGLEPTGAEDPLQACLRREWEDRALNAVAGLPENLKTVFILVSLEGVSYAEAAEILGLTVEAVRMRMSRARRTLKDCLMEEGITP